jgi:serine/threonine-protein kinase
MGRHDSWRLREGDPITEELTAVRLLGGGSSYEAYLAFDEITYGPVVVKVLRPSRVADETALRGLRREVDMLALVNHPVVVRGLRERLDGDRPHVVLECIDGPRLSSLVRRHGPLPPQQHLPLAIDIASALHYFRHVDVAHLDIKPSNSIMGSPARLIDLSVARSSARAADLDVPIGTDAWMAPEQAEPGRLGRPGHASDVWGLGTTLCHAGAGYRAFDAGDPEAVAVRARFPQLVDAPYELPERTHPVVTKTVLAMLEPDPADRPLPHEVAGALEPVLADLPAPQLSYKVRG